MQFNEVYEPDVTIYKIGRYSINNEIGGKKSSVWLNFNQISFYIYSFTHF